MELIWTEVATTVVSEHPGDFQISLINQPENKT